MANIQITQLPAAAPLTGTESVPVVQNGITVRTTTGDIAQAPILNQPFLVLGGAVPSLPNSRYFTTSGAGLQVTDNGPQGAFTLNLTGINAALNSIGNGFLVKTGVNTLINASFEGANNQIDVVNGDGLGGLVSISLASNPVIPGNGDMVIPKGTTAQRVHNTIGAFRYNSETEEFEGYGATGWGAIGGGGAVSWPVPNTNGDLGPTIIDIGQYAGLSNPADNTIAIGVYAGTNNQSVFAIGIGYQAGGIEQGSSSVGIGNSAGAALQGYDSVAIGHDAGYSSQGQGSVAIGSFSGEQSQGVYSVAIGSGAANGYQGNGAVSIGVDAGQNNQGNNAIAIGNGTALVSQTAAAIAIGSNAGYNTQGLRGIAIGDTAGFTTQTSYAIAIGSSAGNDTQGFNSIAIGRNAGKNSQLQNSIAIGTSAGLTSQGEFSLALGFFAGEYLQGTNAIAIGQNAGNSEQGANTVAIGAGAGVVGQGGSAIAIGEGAGAIAQLQNSIAIGCQAGNTSQSDVAVAIGLQAGYEFQGQDAVAIGRNAGFSYQPSNTIILNATGGYVNGVSAQTDSFYVAPIRNDVASITNALYYDTTTKEVTYGPTAGATPGGITGSVQFNTSGAFDGSSAFTYLSSLLTVPNLNVIDNLTSYTPFANTIASFASNTNDFQSVYAINTNNGSDASADIVAYNDASDVNSYFIDMGIGSSNYTSATYPIFPANAGYLYTGGGASGQASSLLIGTSNASSDIILFTGGVDVVNTRAIIKGNTGHLLINQTVDDGIHTLQLTGGAYFNGDIHVVGSAYADADIGSDPHQLVTKEYVDNAVSAGLHIHEPVRLAQSTNLTATYTGGGTTPTVTAITGGTVLTSVGNGLLVDDMIIFNASANGLVGGATYFVFEVLSADTFTVSLTVNGPAETGLTNGTGLTITSVANSGVGATLTNAGTQTALVVDGIATAVNDRILVNNQTTGYQNGVYTVTSIGSGSTNWILTRATDADKYGSQSPTALGGGDYFFVTSGDTGDGESFVITNIGEIIFGVTTIVFTLFSATPIYTGLAPINVSGQVISLTGIVDALHGGTGTGTVAVGDLLYGSAADTWSKLPLGSAYKSLLVNASGTQVEWNAIPLNQTTAVSGQLGVSNGGTGASTDSGARTNLGLVIGTDIPSPTGTGASGTWGISISGNAATVTNGVYTTDTGTVTNTMLAGSIANAKLLNSAITINGTSTALGGSISVGTVTGVTATAPVASSGGNAPVISMHVADATNDGYLSSTDWNTFNSKGVGSVTSVGGTGTVNGITLTGTVTSTGNLTLGGTLSGIGNSQLTNSSITINGSAISLGGTVSVGTVTSVSVSSSNGFAGSSSGGATPTLTLSTTVIGMVKGDGTTLSVASAGTDYVAPSAYASTNGLTMATARILGRTTASSGPAEEISIGTGLTLSGGTLTSTGSGGTVTAVSVASSNGFAGTSSGGATPILTLTTSINGVLKGNGSAISAATAGTDYSAGTSALGTGILKSTTSTGALTIAIAGTDYVAPSAYASTNGLTMSTATLLGRTTAGSGDAEEITVGSGLTLSGGSLTATGGSGTVTSVGFTGGIISVATPTTTPAFTVAGTSGGIPYFASGTTWASSGALTASQVMLGGGAGAAPTTLAAGTSGQRLCISGGIPTWDSSNTASVFTTGTAQTYTVPVGCTALKVTVVGGGAAGGGTGTVSRASGGGAGGVAIKWLAVTPGGTLTYTVGGVATSSTVSSGTITITTITGGGGTAGTATAYAISQTAGGAGGAATNGDINMVGQAGGTSYGTTATLAGNFSGGGASGPFGQGGQMSAITAVAGKNATGFGAGGGGSIGNATAGTGTAGLIIFEAY